MSRVVGGVRFLQDLPIALLCRIGAMIVMAIVILGQCRTRRDRCGGREE
jgi:hypothetical protein